MTTPQPDTPTTYFSQDIVLMPSPWKTLVSRLAFPLLTLLSREQSLKVGLTPIDDERVVIAARHTVGKLLDVGCGANNFVHTYGHGTGVDVVKWSGCDVVIRDAATLPFAAGSYGTVSYLACLNHIPNRDAAVKEAARVLEPGGRVLVTMITPRWGRFIHWWRRSHDPDEQERHIDHSQELLGMSPRQVMEILAAAGLVRIRRKRFVFGLNNLFIGEKPS